MVDWIWDQGQNLKPFRCFRVSSLSSSWTYLLPQVLQESIVNIPSSSTPPSDERPPQPGPLLRWCLTISADSAAFFHAPTSSWEDYRMPCSRRIGFPYGGCDIFIGPKPSNNSLFSLMCILNGLVISIVDLRGEIFATPRAPVKG